MTQRPSPPKNGPRQIDSKIGEGGSPIEGTVLNEAAVVAHYNEKSAMLGPLSSEVEFSIAEALKATPISIDSIQVRVKDLASTIDKCQRKGYTDFAQVTDLVGARIICRFRSDLLKLRDTLGQIFDILDFDEKSISDPDKFGYMSEHYLCTIKSENTGPRYDRIKTIVFEIQVRTICMHAWSSIQHALEYKGEWDVPDSLKKDINALSALFYLADTQFEGVSKAKGLALSDAVAAAEDSEEQRFGEQGLNLETLVAFAASKFPDRPKADAGTISKLLYELNKAGFDTIGQLSEAVDNGTAQMIREDRRRDQPYNFVGAIRVSVAASSKEFEKVTYGDKRKWSSK